MNLEEAVKSLEDNPAFDVICDLIKQYKTTHVDDLSNMANAENPQLLAYLAGGISALNIILNQIDECRSKRPN